jgi:hypothetical protein
MTAFLLLAKGISLIVLSLAAFTALAWMLGFEPAIAKDEATRCGATPAPICMFTII